MARCTILLPDLRRIGDAPLLQRWLARGDRQTDVKPGREGALRACFQFTGTALPAAALTRSVDAGDAAGAQWVRADPCHVVPDAVAVRMLAWSNLELSTQESDELARALRPLFGDAGFPLEASSPQRWYLRCPDGARLPRFADPTEVLGADLLPHMPHGDNERQWRHLLNEAQVILHNHPVNAQRARDGRLAANSVWFWGAGRLPDWVRAPYARVFSDDVLVIALARMAKIAASSAAQSDIVQFDAKDTVLLDLSAAAGAIDAWCEKIQNALRTRRCNELELRLEDGRAVRYKPWHRWRVWRRGRFGGA